MLPAMTKLLLGQPVPLPKRAHRAEEVNILPSPPPPPTIEELAHSQPESFTISVSASVLVFKPSTVVCTPTKPIPANVGVDSLWPPSIQRLVLALTRTPSLLEDPSLAVLLTKNALRPGDHRHLNEVETIKLSDNVMHSFLKSALCTYMVKKHNKILRQEFGVQKRECEMVGACDSYSDIQVNKLEKRRKGRMQSSKQLCKKIVYFYFFDNSLLYCKKMMLNI